jgi:hypothetical protein
MPSRRSSSHVRPRPPSRGRPTTQPVKVAAPDRRRVRQHQGMDARRPRAPLATRTLLWLSIAGLAIAVFVFASGGIGPVLNSLAGSFGNAIGRLTATPLPSATTPPPADAPSIASPEQPYTNQPEIALAVTVPQEAVGDPTAKILVYLALEGLDPAPIVYVPVGTTSRITVPFQLTDGRNDITATLFRGEEESEPSPLVTWYLDREAPKITVKSPKNGSAVDVPDVTIKGTTQAGTSLVAVNGANGTSISSLAAKDGTFEFGMLLAAGTNQITITGTDPAGNTGETKLKLIQGSKEMGVRLTASSYRISVSKPPASIQLSVLVTDPSGAPLAGASAFFTFQIPGLAPISNAVVTGADGRAVFTTPLIGKITAGGGLGTVLVTSELYGSSSDRVTLTFVK